VTRNDAQSKLQEMTSSSRYHMPSYILSKLTTHFGPNDEPNEHNTMSGSYEESEALHQVAFLAKTPQPTKHDFTFQKQLSAGAYGAVWLAKHNDTDEQVAIKVLKKRDMLNKNFVHQVLAEKDILQFARNPFLINLICSFMTKVGTMKTSPRKQRVYWRLHRVW
jgi:hypothetical protein